MDIKVFSKSQIKRYRPQNETVLISVQDVCDAHKSRNFVSHSLYHSYEITKSCRYFTRRH